jgi:hypothetical protein
MRDGGDHDNDEKVNGVRMQEQTTCFLVRGPPLLTSPKRVSLGKILKTHTQGKIMIELISERIRLTSFDGGKSRQERNGVHDALLSFEASRT